MKILKMTPLELVKEIEEKVGELRRIERNVGVLAGKKSRLEECDRAERRAERSKREMLDLVQCLRLHAIDR